MVLMAFVALTGWAVALGADKAKIDEGQEPVAIDEESSQRSVDMEQARTFQPYEGEFADQRPTGTQPAWAQLHRGERDEGTARSEAQGPAMPGKAAERKSETGSLAFGESGRSDRADYWQDQGRQLAPRWRSNAIYGYVGEGTSPATKPGRGAVGSMLIEDSADKSKHSWSHAENLVDNNLLQTRDTFDVPGDYYTKEWKVGEPPIAAHSNFLTIYDNDATQSYYTPWYGSPVLWAPNEMVPVAMPQATHEILSERQMVTYFTTWKDGPRTNAPGTYILQSVPTARATEGATVYGYRGEGDQARKEGARDGSLHIGSRTLFWDDQDVINPPARALGMRQDAAGVYGYISPESTMSTSPGARATGEDVLQNVPRSTGVDIFGVPGSGSKRD
jgi:hypothetical protein